MKTHLRYPGGSHPRHPLGPAASWRTSAYSTKQAVLAVLILWPIKAGSAGVSAYVIGTSRVKVVYYDETIMILDVLTPPSNFIFHHP